MRARVHTRVRVRVRVRALGAFFALRYQSPVLVLRFPYFVIMDTSVMTEH